MELYEPILRDVSPDAAGEADFQARCEQPRHRHRIKRVSRTSSVSAIRLAPSANYSPALLRKRLITTSIPNKPAQARVDPYGSGTTVSTIEDDSLVIANGIG